MTNQERIFIGDIGVDSGTVLLTDPCYWTEEDEMEQLVQVKGEDAAVELGFEDDEATLPSRGILADTREGDGIYPVFAILDENGKVMKLEIVFFEEGLDTRFKEYRDKLNALIEAEEI